jgi:hypothetical protein
LIGQDRTDTEVDNVTQRRYNATDHVRDNMTSAADEGAIFLRKLLRGEIENTGDNRALAATARGALGAFTRYEATLSARDQTSVVVSKLLAGDDPEEFQRYVKASLPDHPAIREIDLRLEAGGKIA